MEPYQRGKKAKVQVLVTLLHHVLLKSGRTTSISSNTSKSRATEATKGVNRPERT